MKITRLLFCSLLGIFLCGLAYGQPENIMTESGEPLQKRPPLDDIVEKRLVKERRLLPYQQIREADIMWERRIWRVIDTREKLNLVFRYEERPFITVLMDAAKNGEITVYSQENDKFSIPLAKDEVAAIGASVDTILRINPETYEPEPEIVVNTLNPLEVTRYRIKEIVFFDKQTSRLYHRILGIAPIRDVKDENDNFLYEEVLFWVYYPEAREVLAGEEIFLPGNDAAPITWENLFEMRLFSSYIYKRSNVFNRRLEDYLSGMDLLLEADRIKQEIFNFEHDLWTY
jgi:gliding motility associated protien GldN